jgi:probable HAF family extracellular repeat protein
MKRHTLTAAVALLVLVPWIEAVRAEPPQYTVQNLGTFGGIVPAITGINASGQVVGNVVNSGLSQAVRYTAGAGWQPVHGLETAFYSAAFGINANGDVVGFYINSDFQIRAFRARDSFPLDEIAPLQGGASSFGLGINDSGDIVGYSDTATSSQVAFRASPPMAPVQLPSLDGTSLACGLNASGQAAGWSLTPSAAQHAIRIDSGSPTALDIVPFDGAAGTSQACAIDAAGTVGGKSSTASGQLHAFRYNGTLLDLDTFGSAESNVESLAGGLSVGWYTVAPGAVRAFAHRDADGSFDLNTRISAPGWVLVQAFGVNAAGTIVGNGTLDGADAAFLLTPSESSDTTAPVISSVTASPDSIYPPNGAMVSVAVTVNATDNSGETPVCTLTSITGGAPGDSSVTPSSLFGSVRAVAGTTYTLTVTCVDAAGNPASGATSVTVERDHVAPVISSVSATPDTITPPDNRLVPVTVSVSATDDVDAVVACSLTSITGGAAGNSYITGSLTAKVRAAGGTTYTLNVRCNDAAGNASYGATTVIVPPDTTDPEITSLSLNPGSIWPANGKLVPVWVSVSATDDVDSSVACAVSDVSGAPASDYVITGPFSVKLRATKNALYLVSVTCTDAAGNSSVAAATVSVSKDELSKLYHWNRRARAFLHGLAKAYGHDRR